LPANTAPVPTASNALPEERSRLLYLDGWRAIAVLVVITSHLTGFRHDPLWLKEIARWLPAGQIGVLIFFFISGFVISRSALSEIETTSSFSVRAFYIRRAFRIIPPLVLYLVVCLALGALGIVKFQLMNALPAFLYVCNVGVFNQCQWLGGHTWSLAFEEQFYLLFPALLLIFLLHRRPFLPHLIGAILFCLLPLVSPLSYAGPFDFYLVYGLFGAGFLAARYQAEIAGLVQRYANLAFLVAAALVLATPFTLPVGWLATIYPLSFLVTIPVMVFAAGSSFVSAPLTNGVLRHIGRISYSIYLWQELATSDLFRHGSLIGELLAIGAVIVWAALLFEVMEKPLIRLGRRLSEEVPLRRRAAS
jgi:peptidoglycan/LPS O-acetylase OafA/YrhL